MVSFKFQTRITFYYLGLFVMLQSLILLSIAANIYGKTDGDVEGQLSIAAKYFEGSIEARESDFIGRAKDQTRAAGFKEAIVSNELLTIRTTLATLNQRVEADLSVLYDIEDGRVVTVVGVGRNNAKAMAPLSAPLQEQAEDEGVAKTILVIDGRIYKLVIVPVLGPDPLAMLAVGFELNQNEAVRIKESSYLDLDIAFIYKEDGVFQAAATTSNRNALNRFLADQSYAAKGAVFKDTYLGESYYFWRVELDYSLDGRSGAAALLYYEVNKSLQQYYELGITVGYILAFSVIVLILFSMVLARGVTRPLRRLANSSQRIAEGDYHTVHTSAKGDEIADLTDNFNRMVAAVQERESKITYQAFHDVDTGLPNRNRFERNVCDAVEKKTPFALVVIEVQQLSELRGVLNHANINALLAGVGARIKVSAGSDVCRLSTDAFAFLLEDHANPEVVAALVINAFLEPFVIEKITVDTSVKLGLSKFPGDTKDGPKLIQDAISALDQGRQSPRGFAWYEADTTNIFKQRLSLMSDFREALTTDEIFFAYQPKLTLKDDKIHSTEALVRWISPTRGFVAPDEFIPFAERTGDVKHLTNWGLRTAAAQVASWRRRGINVSVAVNLSTNDLMNTNLPAQILKLLSEHNLPASCLKLEVTESAVMHDTARALEVLNMLSSMGLSLSIDDYGTGYSSLSYLKKLPVSELKIDMSFVRNLATNEEDRILVRSTIELGHNLGLSVTAEGVEDQRSLDLLREYGCDCVQGYYISKPVPAGEFEKFLRERTTKRWIKDPV